MSSNSLNTDLALKEHRSVEEERLDEMSAKENAAHKLATKCTSDIDYSTCTQDKFTEIFPTLVEKNHWKFIGQCLGCPNNALSSSQRAYYVSECMKHANDSQFQEFVLPHFCVQEVKPLLEQLVSKCCWKSVDTFLDKNPDLTESEQNTIFEKACTSTSPDSGLILMRCRDCQAEEALKVAVDQGCWYAVSRLCCRQIKKPLQDWALTEASARASNKDLSLFEVNSLAGILKQIVSQEHRQPSAISEILKLKDRLPLSEAETDVATMYVSLLVNSSGDEHQSVSSILEELLKYLTETYLESIQGEKCQEFQRRNFDSYMENFQRCIRTAFQRQNIQAGFVEHAAPAVILRFLTFCPPGDDRPQDLRQNAVVPLMALQTVNKPIQEKALKQLPLVKEEVRRDLFKTAVEQKEWTVVRKFADHALYDDQRAWALQKAAKEKQWLTVLVLADHGMTDTQLFKIHRLIARRASKKLLPKLIERGANLQDILDCLQETGKVSDFAKKFTLLMKLGRRMDADIEKNRFEACLRKQRWSSVLYKVRYDPVKEEVSQAIEIAIETHAVNVLKQLVKFGMDRKHRDLFFPEAVQRKLWAVVRHLIEHGVSHQLCQEALGILINERQYVLVARVMELGHLEDSQKTKIIEHGFAWEEGSVVVHGINVLKIPPDERKEMYRRSSRLGMLQVVKRLIEEKDETGAEQCNLALVAAVENHWWDVLKHSVNHGAKVDQPKADGNTCLQKSAVIKDWKAVKQLIACGADTFLPDTVNLTVLQRAVSEAIAPFETEAVDTSSTRPTSFITEVEYQKSMDDIFEIVHILVQFHGDLTTKTNQNRSPLHELLKTVHYLSNDPTDKENVRIINQCADVIEETLFWGKDVCRAKDSDGRTAFHLLCQAGRHKSLYFFLARGSDPEAVTKFGETALLCAVRHPTKMFQLVAECINLGIPLSQQRVSDAWYDVFMSQHRDIKNTFQREHFLKKRVNARVTCSPFELSIIQSNKEMMFMLYESGASSNTELFRLNRRYNGLNNGDAISGQSSGLSQRVIRKRELMPPPPSLQSLCRPVVAIILKDDVLTYLRRIAMAPRSLQSSCRLVISGSLGINHKRLRNVVQLKLLVKSVRDYAAFADLTAAHKDKEPSEPRVRTVNTEFNLALLESLAGRTHSDIKTVFSIY